MIFNLCAPCVFGLESIVGDELRRLEASDVRVENGRVFFRGDEELLCRSNLWLRCAERVLIKLGEFDAPTFEALFQGVRALALENYIPKNGAFPVKGFSLNSKLMSIPDCQRIVKKAAVERLKSKYGLFVFPEDGALYQLQFGIMNDRAVIYLDTTGAGLYKRGYSPKTREAPIRETLAAALVSLSRYRGRDDFYDPFCGSGTIAIEAAMIAKNIAPGKNRYFDAEAWDLMPKGLFARLREEARAAENDRPISITASDIDAEGLALARDNAVRAGVSGISFMMRDALKIDYATLCGTMVTNPPYGIRLLDVKTAQTLCHEFGDACLVSDKLKKYIISPEPDFERIFGKKADRVRKLYNGTIKCNLYMYFKDGSRV